MIFFLLDLKMPQMNGIELSHKLLNIEPNLFYKFITAASKEFIENLKTNNLGIEENIIYKPLWLNEISITIHSFLYDNDQQ